MKAALVVAVSLTALGCAHKKTARTAHVPPPPAETARSRPSKGNTRPARPPDFEAAPATGSVENGIASWYGHPYHGRVAANGEIYDMEQLTAAHRTLPFNTWVHVVNLTNTKTVDVRITDRGPFIEGRVIDLSHAAAKAIDLIGPGTANVRLEILSIPSAVPKGVYAVQVAAFRDKSKAERARERLESQYGTARVVFRQGNPALWRVLVGSEKTEDGAAALRLKISKESGETNAFVVRLDS